jgi:hypothetical protein
MDRGQSGSEPGGQPGSPGATLRQVDDPHEVITYVSARCAGCARSLPGGPVVSIETRQVADVPEMALRWVEHRVEHRACGCGQVTVAGPDDGVPGGVNAPVQYGPGVRAVATYLVAARHLPVDRASAVMSDLLADVAEPDQADRGAVASADRAARRRARPIRVTCCDIAAALAFVRGFQRALAGTTRRVRRCRSGGITPLTLEATGRTESCRMKVIGPTLGSWRATLPARQVSCFYRCAAAREIR